VICENGRIDAPMSDPHADLCTRFRSRDAVVVVFGQGYVGLLVAMRASAAGFEVVGVEPDPTRAAALRKGSSFIEDVSDEELVRAIERGYRVASEGELPAFDVAVIAVPTPLHEGRPDLGAIEKAARQAGSVLRPGALVILESTTYPGTTRELLVPELEGASGLTCGKDFFVGYSPERIDPGNTEHTLGNTPRVVAGIDQRSLELMTEFYGAFVETLVPLERPEEAELTKLLENTFRHVNIALVNELAVYAHELAVDLRAAISAAETKPFGFMPFYPGPGVGGHCLPVDPSYLSWRVERELGMPFRFVELANEVNARMPGYVVRRAQDMLNEAELPVRGARIVVIGLAYKSATADTREAPSVPIIANLRRLGADVQAVDPHVDPSVNDIDAPLVELTPDLLQDSDLVVLLVDHPTLEVDLLARHARRVLDTRGVVPKDQRAVVERL
jgi:nucleotide sugar dehydrogenase